MQVMHMLDSVNTAWRPVRNFVIIRCYLFDSYQIGTMDSKIYKSTMLVILFGNIMPNKH